MKRWTVHAYFAAFLASFAALELLFLNYMIASGLDLLTIEAAVAGLLTRIPIVALPFAAALLSAAACWEHAVKRQYQKYSPSLHGGRAAAYRAASHSFLLLFSYSAFTFTLLVVSSGGIVNALSWLARHFPGLGHALEAFLNAANVFIELEPASRFSVTQATGLTAVTLSALVIGRRR